MQNNVDSSILSHPTIASAEDERAAAHELRVNKNNARNGARETQSDEEDLSLRQRVFALKKANKKKEEAKEGIKAKAVTPIKMGANSLLKTAWLNLIPSWGFSLIWINIHVFMHWVIPDVFCALGQEWIPKIGSGADSKKIAGKAIGVGEVIGLFFLDLIAITIIFGFLAFVVMIVDFLSANLFKEGFMLLGFGWEGIKALVTLFLIPSS